jgi:hypothetical protein
MSKVVKAEYDAAEHLLRLGEPLEGVRDHEQVDVQVTPRSVTADAKRPWMAFSGRLSKEAGEELAQIMDEMFPPWND